MPVKNYSIKSSMKYLPKSHLIDDSEIKFEKNKFKKVVSKDFLLVTKSAYLIIQKK